MTDSSRTSRSNTDISTRRVRVTLRYIEILDSKDIDTVGEFRFRFRAGVPERDDVVESRIPEDEHAHLSISEHPARNRVSMGTVLFEGDVGPGDSLLVEADGEEVDRFTRTTRSPRTAASFQRRSMSHSASTAPGTRASMGMATPSSSATGASPM